MNELRIPMDFEGWPEFRHLEAKLKALKVDTARAFTLWMRLWVELGRQAPATGRLGILPANGVELFKVVIAADLSESMNADVAFGLLVETRILRAEGEEFYCVRFAGFNPQLAPDYKPQHLKGAEMSAFVRRQRKVEGVALGQAVLIPNELFKTPTGEVMDPDSVRRVTMVVKTLDNALGKPERKDFQFSEGLIQDAWRVLQEFNDDQIVMVAREVVSKRGHAGMPQTTEQFLPRFGEVARQVLR